MVSLILWCHIGPLEHMSHDVEWFRVYGATLGHCITLIIIEERMCQIQDSNPGQHDQSQVIKPLGHRGSWESIFDFDG